ncbi:MAG: uroporphyrinogen-III synthase [Methanolobus sp.]|uniref:Uroporphyrinogen-III synthase n=1 Tax=Methanolobus tindarius DSM 2278 TaxID=1090322 RepID=W9DUQ2_METTI|nr:uroporphyrinogen-III synthase [Methanolobus tindarius]ETA67136.1 uroporphyrinogen-III synthase [Methanolobus tindarius DSM 2278]MDI3486562.1 uroporphyrinogen-III synthase [Methanolobus sp.]MDK2939569.1 uroporphyrinogen-III synthase [Methanolobus sp.]
MTDKSKRPVLAIMRPKRYLKDSVELAQSMGFDPLAVPMIELEGMKDEFFDGFVERVMAGKSDYVIFTSANGIDFTLEKIPEEEHEKFISALNSTKVIAIGPTTRKALDDMGINVLGMPGVYSSEGLVEYLCSDVKGKVIDTARSFYGSTLLIEGLKNCGAEIHETNVYTLTKPDGDEQAEFISKVLAGEVDVFAFTSSMMVRNFFEHAVDQSSKNEVLAIMNNSVVAAIGVPTAKTIEGYGVNVSVTPGKFTFEAILKKVLDLLN